MFFKTATLFQLKETVDFDKLEPALAEFPLKEVGPQDEFTFGSMPLVRNSETWSLRSKDCLLMRFGKEEKNLPSAVVREALEVKVAEIELIEGRKVGRKEKADIKEELIFTMRPTAYAKRTDVWMHIDNKAGFIAINASMIEQSFKHLQTMCCSLPMVPLQAQVSPSLLMTEWLQRNSLPASLETGATCDIQEPQTMDKASIAFKNLEPLSGDVTRHLEQGMSVKSLALKLVDPTLISFVLHDDLTVRKIKWTDSLKEAAFNDSQGGAMSDMDATFAISSNITKRLFKDLCRWFEIAATEQEQAA